MRSLVGFTFAAMALACTPDPPPRWVEGGAPLVIPDAVWNRGNDRIELRRTGEVLEDGDLVLVIDRVGRAVSEDHEPLALVLPDGNVAGTDDRYLGRIGVSNASPPWSEVAWLSVVPDGTVLRFDEDGERATDGRWRGCAGAGMRTCTYVTHLFALHDYANQPRGGVGIGVGVGVGIYR